MTARCIVRLCCQDASALRTDGLCFGHGKEADGLLRLSEPRTCGRPPSVYSNTGRRDPGFKVVHLPTYPGRA
jgi:hypothetical protein